MSLWERSPLRLQEGPCCMLRRLPCFRNEEAIFSSQMWPLQFCGLESSFEGDLHRYDTSAVESRT
jgi:hypothetical protein